MMLFRRPYERNKKKTVSQMTGCITSADSHRVVIKLSGDTAPYKMGQRISVSIQQDRRAASGEILKVPEVVAHGTITDISKDTVTIRSTLNNPIISKSTLLKSKGKESVMFVRDMD